MQLCFDSGCSSSAQLLILDGVTLKIILSGTTNFVTQYIIIKKKKVIANDVV
jgi:hypothetical protein